MENDQVASALAVDATASADNLDYIFTLRPGVSFHDGTAFDADAVTLNFNRWFDPEHPLHGAGGYDAWVASFGGYKGETNADGSPKSNFDGIEKVNDMTVLIHLNQPDPDFLVKLTNPAFSIVSPGALEGGAADGGTGPYIVGAWSGSSLSLEPFSGYWDPARIPADSMEVNAGG
jgi:peptide/nickel transport system substrate-binding protein